VIIDFLTPGGQGKGIALLRKVVDAIQHDNYSDPGNKLPSFLITGATGKELTARALANSLAIEDIRVCPGRYFDNGLLSFQFFTDSYPSTAHIITDIETLHTRAESALWNYLKNKKHSYYNPATRSYDNIIHCNGVIVMTAAGDKEQVSESLIEVTDHIIELEPLTVDQMEAVVHQRLVFCGVDYEGDEVLQAIIDAGDGQIDDVMRFLKICLMMVAAEMKEELDMEVVRRASRLSGAPSGVGGGG